MTSSTPTKDNICVWAIHGQLQTPDVWQPFLDTGQWFCIDLRERLWADFDDFAQHLAIRVVATPKKDETRTLLVGYSMGGRLALHALYRFPQLWEAAIIVSADPFGRRDEPDQCLADNEQRWAERFQSEDWEVVYSEWKKQPVFRIPQPPPRINNKITSEDREHVTHWFRTFSKNRQLDFSQHLPCSTPPIRYVSGVHDTKYCAIGARFQAQSARIHHTLVSHAGHRVPWDNPKAFLDQFTKWSLDELLTCTRE